MAEGTVKAAYGAGIYNPMWGIWSGLGGSSKTGRGKKSLIISGGGSGRWAMSPSQFEIFLTFPYFLSLKSFGNS